MYTEFIRAALEAADEIALAHFGRARVTTTGKDNDPNQVVTEADLDVGRELIRRVQHAYPGHAILDEEVGYIPGAASPTPRYTWVVDPIDGTSNFAATIPLFGIMLGLLRDDEPIAGGVSLPALGETYLAERGSGAFCNGQPIAVTTALDSRSVLVAYGVDGHPENPERTRREMQQLAEIVLSARNFRTSNSAFDQMMVARGRYGACLNQSSKIWDNVAAHIIIEEAGGVYTDFSGRPMDYRINPDEPARNYTWCAAPPAIHGQLQACVGGSDSAAR